VYRYSVRGGDSGEGGAGGDGGHGVTQTPPYNRGPSGVSGAAKNISVVVTGTFIWHGGKIKAKVGANGGNGGKGGTGGKGIGNSIGQRGGAGGGGGSGIDSFIGGIIGLGAIQGDGGDNRTVTNLPNYGNLSVADRGSFHVGARGSTGEGSNTNVQVQWLPKGADGFPSIDGLGQPGSHGDVIGMSTDGYAKLWRIG